MMKQISYLTKAAAVVAVIASGTVMSTPRCMLNILSRAENIRDSREAAILLAEMRDKNGYFVWFNGLTPEQQFQQVLNELNIEQFVGAMDHDNIHSDTPTIDRIAYLLTKKSTYKAVEKHVARVCYELNKLPAMLEKIAYKELEARDALSDLRTAVAKEFDLHFYSNKSYDRNVVLAAALAHGNEVLRWIPVIRVYQGFLGWAWRYPKEINTKYALENVRQELGLAQQKIINIPLTYQSWHAPLLSKDSDIKPLRAPKHDDKDKDCNHCALAAKNTDKTDFVVNDKK